MKGCIPLEMYKVVQGICGAKLRNQSIVEVKMFWAENLHCIQVGRYLVSSEREEVESVQEGTVFLSQYKRFYRCSPLVVFRKFCTYAPAQTEKASSLHQGFYRHSAFIRSEAGHFDSGDETMGPISDIILRQSWVQTRIVLFLGWYLSFSWRYYRHVSARVITFLAVGQARKEALKTDDIVRPPAVGGWLWSSDHPADEVVILPKWRWNYRGPSASADFEKCHIFKNSPQWRK